MENSNTVFLSNGVPFWDDLYEVTNEVPYWSVFSVLAKDPTALLVLQIPLTFIFLPGDKLTARLCTSKNGRVIIRRHCRETPLTFEMLETNLIECFNARIGDGQPYVCIVYARNSKPRIVTKQHFSLLCLYLRASHGSSVSASYGRDEHALATILFPKDVMCVQAYVPLERPIRYISVFLRSPFATISEVYQNDVQYSELRSANDELSTTERDLFFPVNSEEQSISKIRQQTSCVLACIRHYHRVNLTGFVGEFVRDTEGRIYFISVLRVSAPHVCHFSGNLREWHPPHMESVRIDATPKIEAKLGSLSHSSRGQRVRPPREPDQTARSQSARVRNSEPKGFAHDYPSAPRPSIMRATQRRQSGVCDQLKTEKVSEIEVAGDQRHTEELQQLHNIQLSESNDAHLLAIQGIDKAGSHHPRTLSPSATLLANSIPLAEVVQKIPRHNGTTTMASDSTGLFANKNLDLDTLRPLSSRGLVLQVHFTLAVLL